MSLADDAGQNGMSVLLKSINVLNELLKYIVDKATNKTQREIAKIQLAELKTSQQQHEALRRMNGVFGMMSERRMQATGKPLDTMGMTLTREQLLTFSEYAKREGLQFYAMENARKADAEPQLFVVGMFKEDYAKAVGVYERVVTETKVNEIDNAIAELKNKQSLTDEEKTALTTLEQEREQLRHSGIKEYNQGQNKEIFESVVTNVNARTSNFNHAFDRYTGGVINRNMERYVCDRANPQNYIECHSYNYDFHGKSKIGTDYTVYRNDEKVLEANDRFFENRSISYWSAVKKNMQRTGGLSDDLLVFDRKEDLQKYRAYFNEQQEELNGLDNANVSAEFDYSEINSRLWEQLKRNGATMKDNIPVDIDTGKPLSLDDARTDYEEAKIAETFIVCKQISNYDKMEKLETQIDMKATEIEELEKQLGNDLTQEQQQPIIKALESKSAELQALNAEYKNAEEVASDYMVERGQVNGAQAEQMVEAEYMETHSYGNEYDLMEQDVDVLELDTMKAYEAKIQDIRAGKGNAETKNATIEHTVEKADLQIEDR